MEQRFRAYRVFQAADGAVRGQLVEMGLDELGAGDVVVRVAWSGVNYKDALAATGAGRIMRRFPLVGGIDFAGTVVSSGAARFAPGDDVLATGYGLGESHDGGFAEYVRVPADWLLPLPTGIGLRDAMAIGTAGFTAALSVVEMERNGLQPDAGPVIVTGATGGVGSLAVQCLATAGYQVTALTRKDDAHAFLRAQGAADVLSAGTLNMGTRPLEKSLWAGAVDPVGGDTLAWLTRTMRRGRLHCQFGTYGRHRTAHHGDALHSAWRAAAGHRLGAVPDGDPPGGLAAAGSRSQARAPGRHDGIHHVRRVAGGVRYAAARRSARPLTSCNLLPNTSSRAAPVPARVTRYDRRCCCGWRKRLGVEPSPPALAGSDRF